MDGDSRPAAGAGVSFTGSLAQHSVRSGSVRTCNEGSGGWLD